MEKTTPCAVIATLWINSTQWPRTLVPTVEQMAGQMVHDCISIFGSTSAGIKDPLFLIHAF
jgi:hypothetical protein